MLCCNGMRALFLEPCMYVGLLLPYIPYHTNLTTLGVDDLAFSASHWLSLLHFQTTSFFPPQALSFSSPLLLPSRTLSMNSPAAGGNLPRCVSVFRLTHLTVHGTPPEGMLTCNHERPSTAKDRFCSLPCGYQHINQSSMTVRASQQIRQYSGSLPLTALSKPWMSQASRFLA